MEYVLFNVKTDYSLLSSLISMNDLFSFCIKENVRYISICDNNLAGSLEFMKQSISLNINFALGLELKFDNFKFSLYAKNYDGYKNLLKINTLKESTEENVFFTKYTKYLKDLICVIDYEYITNFSNLDIFETIFIGYTNQFEKTNALIINTNVIFNKAIKVLNKEDNVYLKYLNDLGGLNNLMNNSFLEKVDNEKVLEYQKFFSLINISLPKSKLHIPKYTDNDFEYLTKLSTVGLNKRLNSSVNEDYKKRLDYELSVINKMGFTSYFLVVYDYVLFAKKNGILVGPGRGSAAGSLVCYSIGITDIDPIKYDLLFERFLNEDRVTMPDIDIDFDSEKREDIISYVREKYGSNHVAVGSTYNTLKSKLVLREICKIENIDTYLVEKFLKVINRNLTLKDNLNNEVVSKYLKQYPELKKVYKISLKLENIKKNVSTHAAGVVICDEEIDNIIPIFYNEGKYKTGVSMDNLENLGILKMDFLGLKNLTVISNILKEINITINDINLNDECVINIFKNAKTDGIFQYETFAMKEVLRKLKPNNFDEIIAAVALVRPGPNNFLGEYINGKNNPNSIVYLKNLEPILKETYGIILYQEQVIKILCIVGGFSASEADNIRRAISKKKENIILKSKDKFINNAINLGYSVSDATNLFMKIEKFAGYGFNKSHSVAYALIGYQMAYLKVYYEAYFVKEILSGSKDISFIEGYINEVKSKNINVLKPDINYSKNDFYILNNKLMLPLNLIKGINKEIENKIIVNAPYEDIFDFYLKNKDIKIDIIKNLIYAGALRSFKINIKTLINNLESILLYTELNGLAEKPLLINYDEYESSELSNYELSMYGFYISNHPSSKYKNSDVFKLVNKENNLFKNIKLIVKIESKKDIKTKKGDSMAFLKVSDETGSDDVVVFSDNFNKVVDIKKGDFVMIYGKINKNQDKINFVLSDIKIIKE